MDSTQIKSLTNAQLNAEIADCIGLTRDYCGNIINAQAATKVAIRAGWDFDVGYGPCETIHCWTARHHRYVRIKGSAGADETVYVVANADSEERARSEAALMALTWK